MFLAACNAHRRITRTVTKGGINSSVVFLLVKYSVWVKIFAIDFPAGRPRCKIKIRAQLKVLVWKTISINNNTKSFKWFKIRDVPDPDTGIRYPVKFYYPVVSGIR